ncbi:hypothetical protein GLYMA_15G108100v4 [Glycine max]|uniref:Uncharacterized protein n=1 Tax=Glycine soja TaxID=3848 RepID=A0A445GS27_GLYSO|nr:uncharacterized protein LOC121173616 [Glycine max]KAG4381255.1 hypothetical protein GLYMA_15G108100v4 [Glycine max]KAH1146597.1 hypothetical protein GYH30_041984 [Glycine max]RZB64046.1 hypothetical protein D0Y65_040552 [Glycine soja]
MLPSLHHFKVQELVDGVLYNIGAAGSYNFKHVIKGLRYWYGSIRRQCFMISKLSYLIEPCQYHMQTLIMACNNWQLANTLKMSRDLLTWCSKQPSLEPSSSYESFFRVSVMINFLEWGTHQQHGKKKSNEAKEKFLHI